MTIIASRYFWTITKKTQTHPMSSHRSIWVQFVYSMIIFLLARFVIPKLYKAREGTVFFCAPVLCQSI